MSNASPEVMELPPQVFQKRLADLIAESRTFAVAEDLDSISVLLSDWLPSISRLLSEALTILDDLERLAEQATTVRADIRQRWSRSTGALVLPRAFDELADLCFMAAAECRACLRQLEPLSPDSDAFTLLVVMERAQARLSGGLCAVEARLAQMSGRASITRHVDLGRKSLRARRLVASFRLRLAGVAQQAEEDTEKLMRSIGTSFAWLLGHDHCSSLRASERLTARLLHQRILDWLRAGDSPATGHRLWHDVSAFVELLRLINRRPEVVQHDYRIVLEVSSVLADSDPHGPLPSSVVEPLNSILGRDELLDEMLGTDVDCARVLARLLEIYSLLERQGAAAGDPGAKPPSGGRGGSPNAGSGRAAGRGRPGTPRSTARSWRPKPAGKRGRAVA